MPTQNAAEAAPPKSSNNAKKKRRARNGSGHWYPRGKRFVAVYRWPGRKYAVQRTCETENDARALVAQVEAEKRLAVAEGRDPVDPGGSAPPVSGSDAPDIRNFRWLAAKYEEAHGAVSAGTWRNRRPILQKHLVPFFGDDPIEIIDLSDLENYREVKHAPDGEATVADLVDGERVTRWDSTALPAITVNHHISLLKLIFKWAVARKYLTESPALELSRLKVTEDNTRRVPTVDEMKRLLKAIVDPEKRSIVHTVSRFGLRIGEGLGLPLDPFDEDYENALLIKQAVHVLENGAVDLGPPKTTAAVRRLPASAWKDSVYAEQVARLTGRPNPHSLLYPARNGEPRSANNARRDILKPALLAAGLPERWGWHDLRRGFITSAFKAGTDDKVIMLQAGHTDIRTTQRYNKVPYDRLMDEGYDPYGSRP